MLLPLFLLLLLTLLSATQSAADLGSIDTNSSGLRCGINNAGTTFEPEYVPATGSTPREASRNIQAACTERLEEKIGQVRDIVNSLKCPNNCPNQQQRTTIELQCNPGSTTATCDPDTRKRMAEVCKPFLRYFTLDACLNFICAQPPSDAYFGWTTIVGKITGFISCHD